MGRRAQIVVTAVAVAVFTLPGLLFLAGVRPGDGVDENRRRTDLPELSAGSVLDEAAYAAVAGYYSDRLPLRDVAIRAEQDLAEAISLNEAQREGVPTGSDGWLYHPDSVLDECPGSPPQRFVDRVDVVAAAAEDAGVPFLVVVAPDKVSVYPQHQHRPGLAGVLDLGSTEIPGCAATWNDALGAATADRPYLLHPLAELRDAAERTQVYARQDTHWTEPGTMPFVEAVVTRLGGEGFWRDEALVDAPDREAVGDLARLRGEDQVETTPGQVIERFGVSFTHREVWPEAEHPVTVFDATTGFAPLIGGSTWIVGDSFALRSRQELSRFFDEWVMIPHQSLGRHDLDDLAAELGHGPDRIVVVQVQRSTAQDRWELPLDAVAEHLAP